MHLTSLNLGHARAIQNGKPSGQTGIYKLPSLAAVPITQEGLSGDVICDLKNHGGPDQAVYIFGQPDYDWWSHELGLDLPPGTFGENLTVSDLESASLSIGDYLHVGTVTLQVSAPRIPCATLAARMDDPAFVKRFRYGERPGLYCRVLRPGSVRVGDPVRLEPYTRETVTVLEMFRNWYEPNQSADWQRRYQAAPIAIRAVKAK